MSYNVERKFKRDTLKIIEIRQSAAKLLNIVVRRDMKNVQRLAVRRRFQAKPKREAPKHIKM